MNHPYFFDDAAIVAEHDALLDADGVLRAHATASGVALAAIVALLEEGGEATPPEQQRLLRHLAWRSLRAAGAALRLGRSGFFLGAFGQAREVLECAFLLDLFRRFPEELDRWQAAEEVVRRRDFSPAAVRRRLDGADGFRERRRERAHQTLLELSAEPLPLKLHPAADPHLLRALLSELRLRLSEVVLHLLRLPLPQPASARAAIVRFRQTIRELEAA